MAVPPTDWKSRVTDLDARDSNGQPLVIPWMEGSDDVVSIDLSGVLDEGETLNYLTVTPKMVRLRTVNETADTDVTGDTLEGDATVSGTSVLQRVNSLVAGYYYHFRVLHGPAGNRRGSALYIRCVE